MARKKLSENEDLPLGERLRTLRESEGWKLREVAARAGVNHGYLSQLERGEVSQPAPAMLHKLANGYGESFVTLMRWAGYIEQNDSSPTPNQQRALSYLGEDVSDEELAAIKAVLDVLRKKRATMMQYAHAIDQELTPHERLDIRSHVLALLRRADVLGVVPTPLDRVMDVARLVAVGEITLEPEERLRLRKTFGPLVDRVMASLQGAIHFRAREVWVRPDLHVLRKRFVTAHEIGHDVLPWQRDAIAYLDDSERLSPAVRFAYERQANQAAIELLAQGDRLRKEADDSHLTTALLSQLSAEYEISMQAISRRVVEESRRDVALSIRFRGGSGRLGPTHVYCSKSFSEKFGWNRVGVSVEAQRAVREAVDNSDAAPVRCRDQSKGLVSMDVDAIETPRARLALFTPVRKPSITRRFVRASSQRGGAT